MGSPGGSGADKIVATSADGYTVTINADVLAKAGDDVKGDEQATSQMHQRLNQTMVPTGAFGQIPNGLAVAADLKNSFTAHVRAVTDMGLSVNDLGSRIQKAASLAFDSEPTTRKVATLNAPSGMLTPQQVNPSPNSGS